MLTVVLALLVVVLTAAPFLVIGALFTRAWRQASLDEEIARLVRGPGSSH